MNWKTLCQHRNPPAPEHTHCPELSNISACIAHPAEGRERTGDGGTAARKETLVSAFAIYPRMQKPCLGDHQWMKPLDRRLMGNFTKKWSRWTHKNPSGPTWWNLASLRVAQPYTCLLILCARKYTASPSMYFCQGNLNWNNPVSLTSVLVVEQN